MLLQEADLLEESLFASDDQGKMYYRHDVAYELSWMKRNNVDVYAVLALIALFVVQLGFAGWKMMLQPKFKAAQKLKIA